MEKINNIINTNFDVDRNMELLQEYFNDYYFENMDKLVDLFARFYGEEYKYIINDRLHEINIHITIPSLKLNQYINQYFLNIDYLKTKQLLDEIGDDTRCFFLDRTKKCAVIHDDKSHTFALTYLGNSLLLGPNKKYVLQDKKTSNKVIARTNELCSSILIDADNEDVSKLRYLRNLMKENNYKGLRCNIGDKCAYYAKRPDSNFSRKVGNRIDVFYDYFSLTPEVFIHELIHALSYGIDNKNGLIVEKRFEFLNELITQELTFDIINHNPNIREYMNKSAVFNCSYNPNLYLVDKFYKVFRKDIKGLYFNGDPKLIQMIGNSNYITLNRYVEANSGNTEYDQESAKRMNILNAKMKLLSIIKR